MGKEPIKLDTISEEPNYSDSAPVIAGRSRFSIRTALILLSLGTGFIAGKTEAKRPHPRDNSCELYQGPKSDAGWVLLKGKCKKGLVEGYGEARRKGIESYATEEIYKGNYSKGKRHGRGILFRVADRLEGGWREDKMHGRVVLVCPPGKFRQILQYQDGISLPGSTVYYDTGLVSVDRLQNGKITSTASFSHPKYKTPNSMYVYAGKLEITDRWIAVMIYEKIIQDFPNSPAAVKATDRLHVLRDFDESAQRAATTVAQQEQQLRTLREIEASTRAAAQAQVAAARAQAVAAEQARADQAQARSRQEQTDRVRCSGDCQNRYDAQSVQCNTLSTEAPEETIFGTATSNQRALCLNAIRRDLEACMRRCN